MAEFLIENCSETKMSMIGYILENTLSENGTVNRGVCKVDVNQNLIEVNERVKLARQNGKVEYNISSDEPIGEVDPKSYVSMNYWGFHPSIFKEIEKGLHKFMEENAEHPAAEYYIPDIVTTKIQSKEIAFSIIPTNDNWFGVTYKEDKHMAIETLNKHIENGIYPKKLWS
jgi:NDP-sugar pyrophosphorylase family protein